jgi:predicted NBD/HSP70 family sugar kinase
VDRTLTGPVYACQWRKEPGEQHLLNVFRLKAFGLLAVKNGPGLYSLGMPPAPVRSPRLRTSQKLYDLIRTGGEVTRAGLVESTGLSRSAVNQAVGALLAAGRIAQGEAEGKGPGSGSGRPAAVLRAVASGAHVAGIDFGHNHVYVALANALGEEIAHAETRLDVDLNAITALDAAAELLIDLKRQHELDELAAVVAGIPGPLDLRTGLVRSPTILSSWVGMYPAHELQDRLGTTVHVENDAVLGAAGELHRGAGRGYDDFLYVKASHGVGAAVVIGGQPYRGATGLAGEIGHTHLEGRTELCRCGDRGCLESAVSVESVREQIAHTRPGSDPTRFDLAALDDAIAQRILNEAGRTIGGVLADLCNLLNPSVLLIGGELGASGPALIAGVDSSVRRRAQPASVDTLRILPAALGIRAEITGALCLAAQRATSKTDV